MATIAQRPATLRAGWAFRAVWSKSLRAYRIPILAWGIGLGLMVMATADASTQISSSLGQQTAQQAVQNFRFFGEPVAIGTPQGYTTFKILGLLPLFLGIWTAIAGAYLTRGDEDRGALDLVLGEPVSRARAMGEKTFAFALGTALVGLMVALGLMLGLAQAKLPVDVSGSLLVGLNLSLSAFVYGALGLFFSQFTRTAGAAAGWAGAYMALDFVVAGSARSSNDLDWLKWITINSYSELSKPIIPSYGANPGALLVLLALSVALVAASLWLFVRRDVGDVVHLWPRSAQPTERGSGATAVSALSRSQHDFSLRSVAARSLAASSVTLIWWAVGIGIYALYAVYIAKSTEDVFAQLFKQNPLIAALFSGGNLGTNNGFVSAILFTFAPFVSVLAAIFFALTWPSDLDQGRLETTLSAPLPRWRLPLERFVTVVVGVVGLGLTATLAAALGGALSGLTLDGARLASAGLGMIPLGLVAAALVYALAGWLSSGVILGLVGGLASLSFLIEFLRSLLKLPDWALSLSIFHVYGQPMVTGINWTGTLVMLALALALLAVGTLRFVREDVRN